MKNEMARLRADLKSDLIASQRETLYIGLMWLRELGTKNMKVVVTENSFFGNGNRFLGYFRRFPSNHTYAIFFLFAKDSFHHKMNFW